MSWTEQNQNDATQTYSTLVREYEEKMEAWKNSLLAGSTTNVGQAAVEDVVRRLRQYVAQLQERSDVIASNDSVMESLGQLATEVAEEKETLKRLRSEAVTRTDQAESVNPKVTSSPYTNVWGLRRVFRNSSWFNIMIASIIFAILALASLSALVYSIIESGSLSPEGFVHSGGQRRT